MFTVPRCTPSLLANVMSRYFIWIVIGTSTVSPVTFTKSERTSNGIKLVISLVLTISSRSLNLTGGGACNFANCSRRSNCLVCCCELFGPAPSCSSPPPLKRLALLDMPIDSYKVNPALGVYLRASFSERSMVMW